MSRIRSLHPGLFTDERYMALSLAARELLKGIWCEADDQGIFEWKPLTLKARIMPADMVNVAELLQEIMEGEFVTRFEISGKSYGAVRNFRKFQRPKKPNKVHLLPDAFRTYVGLSDEEEEPHDDKPPPVPHQFPTSGEKPPQMKEEGGKREDSGSSLCSEPGAEAPPPVVQSALSVVAGTEHKPASDQKKEYYDLVRAVLGKSAGGMGTKLLAVHQGDLAAAIYTMRQAENAAYPAEYIGRIVAGEVDAPTDWDSHPAYRGMR